MIFHKNFFQCVIAPIPLFQTPQKIGLLNIKFFFNARASHHAHIFHTKAYTHVAKTSKGNPRKIKLKKNTYVNLETAFAHIMHLCLLRNFNNCHFSVIKKYASKHVLFPHICSIVYESR